MTAVKKMCQCRLEQMQLYDAKVMTAWIPKREAKVGAMVVLLPSRELWKVTHAFPHGIPEDMWQRS